MSRQRELFLDESPGERRGVVTLDGKPERLLIERDAELSRLAPGAVLSARVTRIERGLGIAFLEAPSGEALVVARAGLPEGASQGACVSVQVTAPARRDKAANAKVLSHDVGPPRWIGDGPSLSSRLQAFAPNAEIETGQSARLAADEAVAAVLEIEHPLPGGGRLTLEATRALIAVDVDVGQAGREDARFSATKTNQQAIIEAARLARLKGLGGLMVIDLAGKGHNGPVLLETAKGAFAPDQPGVALGAISRFGVMELAIPWRSRPVIELLADSHGRPTPLTEALALLRAVEREAQPGRRVEATCSPAVAEAAMAHAAALSLRIGPRFVVLADSHRSDSRWDVVMK